MKIVFTAPEYHQYDPRKGKTNEYNNFYLGLKAAGHEVIFAPFDRILEGASEARRGFAAKMFDRNITLGLFDRGAAAGRRRFNEELLETVQREKPDLFFAFLYTDELEPATLREIKKLTTSVAWFSDDSWRFWNYAAEWAPRFTWAITTYPWRVKDYARVGQPNVVVSQWGVNENFYHPLHDPIPGGVPEVSFVGSWSAPRGRIVASLLRAGIPVSVYGAGWQSAGWASRRVTDEEMLSIFTQSKINLALNPAPGLWNITSLGQLLGRRSVDRFVPDLRLIRNWSAFLDHRIPQIKARHFEVAACGGFTIAGWAEGIEQYYAPDKEMVFYKSMPELIEKVRWYLDHPAEREAIARAGYERTVRDHTYRRRFEDIFRAIGFTK